jgi:hypothetical protein
MKKNLKIFAFSLKKGVGSLFISQRYGSADPDPHQKTTSSQLNEQNLVTDPDLGFITGMHRINEG